MSAVAWGVAGIGSIRAQALGRGPSVEMVRAGRRFVEEARLRIGGGEREAIVEERGEKEKGRRRTRNVWSMEVGTVSSPTLIGHSANSAAGSRQFNP